MPTGQDVPQPSAPPVQASAPVGQRLAALFVAALLLFNFPLLALWDRSVLVFGLPLFPLALFTVWALLIAVLAWWMERLPD
jgi:hypothetical protein